jgi:ribosomal-protein-alanine N-acetyltransferase
MLEVRADNEPARKLYDSNGFEVLTVRRRYYQPGDVDALVMRRRLTEEVPA